MKLRLLLRFIILTTLTISILSVKGFGQQRPDSLKLRQARQQNSYYRKALQVDSVKALQVARIQDSYKFGLNQVLVDTSLNEAAKRIRIKTLMDAKNQQLRLLLSPAQQAKIIPTTERVPVPVKTN